jgi:hypothetical protein
MVTTIRPGQFKNFDEEVDDAVGTSMSGVGGITVIYDDEGDLILISGSQSGGVTEEQLITTSGDIVAQIVESGGITEEQLTTTSGDIVAQIPSLAGYATTAYVTTVSGDIVAQIGDSSFSSNDLKKYFLL